MCSTQMQVVGTLHFSRVPIFCPTSQDATTSGIQPSLLETNGLAWVDI